VIDPAKPLRMIALISSRPDPPISGPRVRNFYLWPALRHLGVEVRVLGCAPSTGEQTPSSLGEFIPFDRPSAPIRAVGALFRSYHQWPYSHALAARVESAIRSWKPHIVHAEELRMAAYLPRARRDAGPLLSLTLHNIETYLQRRTGSSAIRTGAAIVNLLHALSLSRFQRSAIAGVDMAFAYSERDQEAYRQLYPDLAPRIHASRNGTDVSGVTPTPQPRAPGVLLVGSLAYQPNVAGLVWFLREVVPRLPSDYRITVAGAGATRELVNRITASRAQFLDTPRDLGPLYAEHAIAAVPLHHGSGTRTKILEALAHERMVVSTTVGAEGLDLSEGEGIRRADDAKGFAELLVRYGSDRASRAAIALRGREAVAARYDWSAVAADLLSQWSDRLRQDTGVRLSEGLRNT
jgi:glycosyltransferase involved in cell wall biosynthesis